MIHKALLILTIVTTCYLQVFAVDKCFYCHDTCESSQVVEQNCNEAIGDSNVQTSCYSLTTLLDKSTVVAKGCLPHDVAIEACSRANRNADNVCYVCNGDLCNANDNNNAISLVNHVTLIQTIVILILAVKCIA